MTLYSHDITSDIVYFYNLIKILSFNIIITAEKWYFEIMHTKNKEYGFTLLEMVIALIVIGLIAVPFIQEYRLYQRNSAESQTLQNFYTIEFAVQKYYEENGYLPCPAENYVTSTIDGSGTLVFSDATTTASVTSPNFGVQNCAAFENELSDPDQSVLMGSIPVQTLGIDADLALDGWDNKITFVVSKFMVSIPNYDAEQVPPTTLTSTLPYEIDFFSRSTNGILSCNTVAIGGFEERYIVRDEQHKSTPGTVAMNNQRPSVLIQSTLKDDTKRIGPDAQTITEELCVEDPANPGQPLPFATFDADDKAHVDQANHVLLISHGETALGGYNANGSQLGACDENVLDGMNCIRGAGEPIRNNLFYTNGLRLDAGGTGADFYDDVVYAFRADSYKMFTRSRPDSGVSSDVYTPYQIIGIGVDNPMEDIIDSFSQKLPGIDVGGNIKVEPGGFDGSGRALASNICSEQGAQDGLGDCFSPSIIAGSGMGCESINSAMNGISKNNAACFTYTPFAPATTCDTADTGRVMVGVDQYGNIICEVPDTTP